MKQSLSLKTHRQLTRLIVLVACFAIGCSKSDRPQTVNVVGTITFDGQPPKRPGGIFFAPVEVEAGLPKRGGRALFDVDGKFVATSFDPGDGLIPGTYRISVECWKTPPGMGKPASSFVPKGFAPDDLIVSSEESVVTLDLDVK